MVVNIDFQFNSVVFLLDGGNVDLASLLGIFGGPGIFAVVARATDLAGVSHALAFNIEVIVCLVDGDCDDGAFCTGVDTCDSGACVVGPGNPCAMTSSPFCDEFADVCLECLVNGDCDDGLFCTGTETCAENVCVATGDPCSGRTPLCDETQDLCVECLFYTDCAEGEVCSAGECVPSIPASSPGLRVALVVVLVVIACAAPWLIRRRAH